MARISPIEPGQASPEVEALYERLRRELGIEPNNFFKTLGHQPALLAPIMGLTGALLEGGSLDRRLKEWAILQVARQHGCGYVFEAHQTALSRTILSDVIDERQAAKGATGPDEAERLAIRYAGEVTANRVSRGTYESLRCRFSEAEIVELTVLAAFYNLVCRVIMALETDADPLRFLAPLETK